MVDSQIGSLLPEDAFADRTVVMSGGSRGIGLAIACALARCGANIVLLAKTDVPDPRLPGTVHTAVAEIESVGGKALGVVGDLRNGDDVTRAVEAAVEGFGGIDICVNNASALNQAKTPDLPLKRFDLMQNINSRGTFALTQACLPHLAESGRGRILTLSPPLNLSPRWLGEFPGYMLSKYGMTLLTLGFAAEFADRAITANCLWPQTTIATAAVKNLLGGEEGTTHARDPQIMADAAALALAGTGTGECLIDAEVLTSAGVTDLSPYGGDDPIDLDFFVDN